MVVYLPTFFRMDLVFATQWRAIYKTGRLSRIEKPRAIFSQEAGKSFVFSAVGVFLWRFFAWFIYNCVLKKLSRKIFTSWTNHDRWKSESSINLLKGFDFVDIWICIFRNLYCFSEDRCCIKFSHVSPIKWICNRKKMR